MPGQPVLQRIATRDGHYLFFYPFEGRQVHMGLSALLAHRLSSVIAADRILVLDQGKLVAHGTHSQLIKKNPLYARLAKLQFQNG